MLRKSLSLYGLVRPPSNLLSSKNGLQYASSRFSWRPKTSNTLAQATLDTIYGLSSAPGRCGVSIIRISGHGCTQVLNQMTRANRVNSTVIPRKAMKTKIVHPETEEVLDEGLILYFPGPHSFTGEDVLELHVHGSRAVISEVLAALSLLQGTRPAEAGEFTHRAFDNGKLGLTEVEGLADLLNAETESQRKQALRQLSGALGVKYDNWRQEVIRCLAHVEALIDFGEDEDDVRDSAYDEALERARKLKQDIDGHLNDGRRGEIMRDGFK